MPRHGMAHHFLLHLLRLGRRRLLHLKETNKEHRYNVAMVFIMVFITN